MSESLQKNKLLVTAIKDGTVIDHITAAHALKIIRLLNLADHNKRVTVGLNLPSKTMGLKDLIKVEGRELTEEEIKRVAILAPEATINIIKNYQIAKKFHAEIPDVIEYVVVCPNPICITNNENMDSKFIVKKEKNNIKLKCWYCEKTFPQEEIRDYKNN
ncbi:MAG: Aspartate carbamoyltransferase regulatory chain [Candidatus Magasanikbacteria bacterium GW2011_GWC2_34_16]|uniref:Aspartate carbamoyltransferase regulatory chain n=2 Tax=Candidatus Magasanikiibacteriota TaxID=1752731 RepID=A0A0G0JW72_9BACT|nr:MAG: Aspartate carbamoyltransferase regulatory chain [Candidatus Magasanikbacteria bacterium GW2011_GWC2_34_16]KKQ41089.1 MAG: Aspartate carbamoyltransferase regulatory chain [Candidatus Magasanikbacteria bacterium GW2011_GWA2_37_8]